MATKQVLWSTRHKDSRNSDFMPVEGSEILKVKWKALKNIPVATFAGSDTQQHIYTLTLNSPKTEEGTLWAFKPNGELLWTKFIIQPSLTSIAVSPDGNIYVSDGHRLVKVDTKGSEQWAVKVKAETAAVMFMPNGNLLLLDVAGELNIHKSDTGEKATESFMLSGKPMLGVQHGHMPKKSSRLATFSKGLEQINVAKNYTAQTVKRFLGVGVISKNVPAICPETSRIFIVSADDNEEGSVFYGIDSSSKTENKILETCFKTRLGPGCDTSPSLSFDGTKVYCADNTGMVYALSAYTGKIIWQFALQNSSSASISVTPDQQLYISIKEEIICLKDHGEEGTLLWTSQLHKFTKAQHSKQCMINSVLCMSEKYVYSVGSLGKKYFKQFFPFQHYIFVMDRFTGRITSHLPIAHESMCTPSMLADQTLLVPSKPFFLGVMAYLRKKNLLFKVLFPKRDDFHGLIAYDLDDQAERNKNKKKINRE